MAQQYYYIAHHGIKGQKWGVRRYQNPDGTLTKEGRERYGSLKNLNDSRLQKRALVGAGVTAGSALGGFAAASALHSVVGPVGLAVYPAAFIGGMIANLVITHTGSTSSSLTKKGDVMRKKLQEEAEDRASKTLAVGVSDSRVRELSGDLSKYMSQQMSREAKK